MKISVDSQKKQRAHREENTLHYSRPSVSSFLSTRSRERHFHPSTTTSVSSSEGLHELQEISLASRHDLRRLTLQISLTSRHLVWCTIHHLLSDSVLDALHKHKLGLNGRRRSNLGHLHNLRNIVPEQVHAPRGANRRVLSTSVVCHRVQNGKLPTGTHRHAKSLNMAQQSSITKTLRFSTLAAHVFLERTSRQHSYRPSAKVATGTVRYLTVPLLSLQYYTLPTIPLLTPCTAVHYRAPPYLTFTPRHLNFLRHCSSSDDTLPRAHLYWKLKRATAANGGQ